MRIHKLTRIFLAIGVACVLVFGSPVMDAQAQTRQCDCWCETAKGAKRLNSDKTKNKIDFDACETGCDKKHIRMNVCAFDKSQLPSQGQNCFTKKICKTAIDDICASGDKAFKEKCLAGGKKSFDTGFQPPECPTGMHYCYPPENTTSLTLNIGIGGVTEVDGLEQYVNVLYKWMIFGGLTIAIVLVMIGGLQYVLGAAVADQVQKGKRRIQNAVIGLVLLLSSVLIIETVNPQLSVISPPRLPLVKTVLLAGSGQSCEDLANEGYKMEFSKDGKEGGLWFAGGGQSPGCGAVGELTEGPDGASVAEGITCNFKWCAGSNNSGSDRSFCLGSGANAACLWCKEVYDGSQSKDYIKSGVRPSGAVCGRMASGITPRKKPSWGVAVKLGSVAEAVGGKTIADAKDVVGESWDLHERCLWTKDGNVNAGFGINKVSDYGSCNYVAIDCTKIHKCKDYGTVKVFNNSDSDDLYDVDTEPGSGLIDGISCLGACSNFSFKTICEEDPCRIDGGCNHVDYGFASDRCRSAKSSGGGAISPTNNPGATSCFVAGTQVLMADKTERDIESVVVGDQVTSWDEETGTFINATVVELKRPVHNDMIRVGFEHSESINTFDHPFFIVGKGWSSYAPELTQQRYSAFDAVAQMEVGDVALFNNEGELIESRIKFIHEEWGNMQTYIFELDKGHAFFANGMLTHNKQ